MSLGTLPEFLVSTSYRDTAKERKLFCHIGFDNNKVIKDFIRIHHEGIHANKISLSGSYPDYQYDGQNVRKQHAFRWWQRSAVALLPHAISSRLIAKRGSSQQAIQNSLATFFRKHGVDSLFVEFGDAAAYIAPLAAQLQIPLVVHFHGHDAHRTSLLTNEMLTKYRFMFTSAAAILCVSRFMLSSLIQLGCPEDKLIYNPYGPRDKFFSIQPNYAQNVLSVGRFTDIKANYLVVLAFQRALESCPNAKLIMAGDGELLETCKTISNCLGLDKSISFLGAVEHATVDHLFQNACCFAQHSVTPSYGDAEGTPNTILEACAASLPVISTNHAGIPDIIAHERTGYLVAERDINGMAANMVKLLNNQDLCTQIGHAARNRVKTHFSSEKHLLRLNLAIELAKSRDAAGISALSKQSRLIGFE